MSNSRRFVLLARRLTALRNNLLPKVFSPTGTYTSAENDHFLGYRLLVHAEMEFYFEEMALEKIQKAIDLHNNKSKTSRCLFCFLASYAHFYSDDESIKISKNKLGDVESHKDILRIAHDRYKKMVDNNHGIREINLKSVLIPIGLDFTQVDNTWLVTIDDYGKKRGLAAHKSGTVINTINPQDELTTVNDLLAGIKDLDEKFKSYD